MKDTVEDLFASNVHKPLEVYLPSANAVRFWDKMFPRCDEVSVVDYLEAILPVLERETDRKFTNNQLMNLIDHIDFEGRHVINKYESMFFIDRVWNNAETQQSIWNDRYRSVKEQVQEFVDRREKMREEAQKASDGNKYASFTAPDLFKPFTLKDFLPPHRYEKVPHDRDVEFSIECVRSGSRSSSLTERFDRGDLDCPEVSRGLSVDLVRDAVLVDKKAFLKPNSRSKFAGCWPNYSRLLFGEDRFCDLRFPESDVHMGSYHFTLEKFDNVLYLQDMSKHARVKLRVQDKPYVLDEDMVRRPDQVLELGKNKAVVREVYPLVLKMRRCIDSFGFLTRDCAYPYLDVFAGKVGPPQQKRYPDEVVLYETIRDHKELHARRADFLAPSRLKSANRNPSLTLEFFDGELKGEKLRLEKNLLYQLKTEQRLGQVPEVLSAFSLGKDNSCDYAFPRATLKKLQCVVEFSSLWGWQVRDSTGHSDVCRTSVYLASKPQTDRCDPSHFVQLFDKMVFSAGDYDFLVKARNNDPRFTPQDVFEDDHARFHEETEDDVRKKLTGI